MDVYLGKVLKQRERASEKTREYSYVNKLNVFCIWGGWFGWFKLKVEESIQMVEKRFFIMEFFLII